ncbi:NB protein [Influenza B virus (B/Newcastle/1000/2013)]|uniref:Glycoprotein NB n=10 Tax=Influenza B virus TaxID=11520 RepID=A0A126TSI5_9INFB|nr:NB protein [Influenza B virus (B/Newcastle/1000/2013)]AML33571.1 NB protein [Influenza B virus (B/Canberra/20/2013)]AML33696.1 NB protein [Influenza B virus (B/Victoria/19/2013)]AML41368.1 NB protein [Influenza B virus (B/Brisbane/70/2013)]AML41379.1 NB protein [Influenza B virus (B/Townsville/11/2013)]AML41423.1 NB protein [Influenza B virus (B/Brisbane/88/2013)]AML42501.1 NB protein [Influenza B virus (B/Townsville/22/2013)]AML42589.1 NB protein [Influenza B virus (B/Townsville/1/2014)]
MNNATFNYTNVNPISHIRGSVIITIFVSFIVILTIFGYIAKIFTDRNNCTNNAIGLYKRIKCSGCESFCSKRGDTSSPRTGVDIPSFILPGLNLSESTPN